MGACTGQCTKQWAKYLMIGSALILLALGIWRFFSFVGAVDPIQYILNVYFMYWYELYSLLGFLILSMEFGWERILKNFEFYRYFFGKSILCIL